MNDLKRCPCGKVPAALHVSAEGNTPKWAMVYGDCCAEWHIEFRAGYKRLGSREMRERATQAWNTAPRHDDA